LKEFKGRGAPNNARARSYFKQERRTIVPTLKI